MWEEFQIIEIIHFTQMELIGNVAAVGEKVRSPPTSQCCLRLGDSDTTQL